MLGHRAEPVAKKHLEGQVGEALAVGDAPSLEPTGTVALDQRSQLAEQSRLPEPRISAEHEHAARPGRQAAERLIELSELAFATHEWRLGPGTAPRAA
jgi:hypothetical protein